MQFSAPRDLFNTSRSFQQIAVRRRLFSRRRCTAHQLLLRTKDACVITLLQCVWPPYTGPDTQSHAEINDAELASRDLISSSSSSSRQTTHDATQSTCLSAYPPYISGSLVHAVVIRTASICIRDLDCKRLRDLWRVETAAALWTAFLTLS